MLINSCLSSPQKLICVSRPRRFGKSFGAKMLCAYYDKTCDSEKLNSKEFKALWSHINSKSVYVVDFDTDELVKKAILALLRTFVKSVDMQEIKVF